MNSELEEESYRVAMAEPYDKRKMKLEGNSYSFLFFHLNDKFPFLFFTFTYYGPIPTLTKGNL